MPKIVTTGVPASISSWTCSSAAADDVLAPRRSERCEPRVRERPVLRLGEELDVPRVRAGPAALDVVHAEGVEPVGDPQLVGDRERDAVPLRAVAQRGVVDLDVRRHRPRLYRAALRSLDHCRAGHLARIASLPPFTDQRSDAASMRARAARSRPAVSAKLNRASASSYGSHTTVRPSAAGSSRVARIRKY